MNSIDKADYEALAAFRSTLRRFLHFSEEAARAEGLMPQQHQLLLAIKGRPGKDWAAISEIAEALQLRHNAAVGLTDRCEASGWVERSTDPDDRRQVRVTLTASGEEKLSRLSKRHLDELKHLRHALRLSFLEDGTK